MSKQITMPDWVREAREAEENMRAQALPLLSRVWQQFERGIMTVQEFADAVNRIVQ